MLTRLADLAIAAPKRVLVAAALLLVVGAAFGSSVAQHLSSGGFTVDDAESTRATEVLDEKFHGGPANLLFVIEAPGGADSPAAAVAGQRVVQQLAEEPDWVTGVSSYWTLPDGARQRLRSDDGDRALVLAHLRGEDDEATERARELEERIAGTRDGVTVLAGGVAVTYAQVNEQTERDLLIAEAIAIPLTAIALVFVFGSLVASLVPLAVGIFSILMTLAVLRAFALFTDVSIYAMNMTTALGLALAIDYSLFMVSRYREELGRGQDVHGAILTTVRTAGRTVLFSALTVALSLAALLVFPMYFLRSFAYAGLAVVGLAALASLVLLPAVLALIGPRINALDLRAGLRRLRGRPPRAERPEHEGFWYRLSMRVMRRPTAFGLAVVAVLLLLGSPFLRAEFGYPDDRVLTTEQSARVVGDLLREDFSLNAAGALNGVADDVSADPEAVAAYSLEVSLLDGVEQVTSAAGVFADGAQVGPAPEGYLADGAARFDVSSALDPFSEQGSELVDQLRGVDAPWQVLWAGGAAFNVDAMDGLADTLPLALLLIAVATFVVLFLFTGSVVVPVKALLLNLLSLSATFGAMVWVFQDGHLSSLLGFTSAGYLVANMVVLMFCLAFGMSMDYEVFLLSRIREEWEASDHSHEANTRAVALGLARTGRIVTAAAALMAIVFAAMVTSSVQFMQLFGLGLTIAVLTDATLVRGILVPASMRLMGRANWWAPRPLAALHGRIGLRETEPEREPARVEVG